MKQKVFADTNVMVDLLAHRVPFYEAAMRLFSLADRGECTIVVSALSFSTTAYLLERKLNYEDLSLVLRQFASIVEIASVDERTVRKSLSAIIWFSGYRRCHAALCCFANPAVMRLLPAT